MKLNPGGEVNKVKARLVAKGFLQRLGVDFGEVFALVARIETVRLVIAYVSRNNWPIYHLEEVYVLQHQVLKLQVMSQRC